MWGCESTGPQVAVDLEVRIGASGVRLAVVAVGGDSPASSSVSTAAQAGRVARIARTKVRCRVFMSLFLWGVRVRETGHWIGAGSAQKALMFSVIRS